MTWPRSGGSSRTESGAPAWWLFDAAVLWATFVAHFARVVLAVREQRLHLAPGLIVEHGDQPLANGLVAEQIELGGDVRHAKTVMALYDELAKL